MSMVASFVVRRRLFASRTLEMKRRELGGYFAIAITYPRLSLSRGFNERRVRRYGGSIWLEPLNALTPRATAWSNPKGRLGSTAVSTANRRGTRPSCVATVSTRLVDSNAQCSMPNAQCLTPLSAWALSLGIYALTIGHLGIGH
jgi:hypothetical protein